MPHRCGVPTPAVPIVTLPRFAFIQAISPLRSLAGKSLRESTICGAWASSAIGAKSVLSDEYLSIQTFLHRFDHARQYELRNVN